MIKPIQKQQGLGTRTVHSNVHETTFNQFRKYYAFIEIDGAERVFDYVGKFRSEALAYFQEQARIEHGKLTSTVHVYK